jgi:hypothetical protein
LPGRRRLLTRAAAVDFYNGPNLGTPLDASLQAGTGSIDVIVGAYCFQAVSHDFDAFAHVQFQSAVAHKQDQPGIDFRPGNTATISFGLRYEENPKWIPQLQLNLSHKSAGVQQLERLPAIPHWTATVGVSYAF